MLQFWKKSGPQSKNLHQNHSAASTSSRVAISNTFESGSIPPGINSQDEPEAPRLPRTLDEILSNRNALNYFMQFMESRNAACYILCWLDIESFKHDLINSASGQQSPVLSDFHFNHDTVSSHESSPTLPNTPSSPDKPSMDTALFIFKRYIAQEAPMNIKCSDDLRNELVEKICTDCTLCFDNVQNFVWDTMLNDHLGLFLTSDYYCKYQIDVLTGGNVALDDILHNETALFYFMEHLELENAQHLLEFWIAATNFQQQLQTQKEFYDPAEAQSDAVVLYDKYFSLQAHCPLGLGDNVRFDIEQNICGENGLNPDAFDRPLKLVENVLRKCHLRQFLGSQLFYKYLSELINTVQSNGYGLSFDSSKSDCSSEKSYSTNSTFLAMEINHNSPSKRAKDKTDMTIDTRLLNDPDSLWKRKRTHMLSCGRVTALGKFETDLEPEPDRKAFKLKNVMKKFVSLDDDKKKEEMAWQVAEMIVNDITSVTLSKGNPSTL